MKIIKKYYQKKKKITENKIKIDILVEFVILDIMRNHVY